MKTLYLFPLLFLFLSSCIEPIKFNIDRQGGQLVVDGSISNEGGLQRIKLSTTTGSDRIPTPVTGAQVKIFDDMGLSEDYVTDFVDPGTYILLGHTIQGTIERTYYIEIVLFDGRTYRSVPEKIRPQPGEMEAISYDFSEKQEVNEYAVILENTFIDVFIDVDLNEVSEEPFFLRWDVEEVFLLSPTDFPDPFAAVPPPCYVYVYPSATDLNLFDGSKSNATYLDEVQVASQKLDYGFREKHYFSVYQKSLGREAFEYWKKVDQLLSNAGNVFDTPPAPIPGNIYNINNPEEEVLGYFEAVSSSVIRFNTYRSDIPLDQILECKYIPSKPYQSYPDYCLNCLTRRNSTYERPPFF